jgi:hypothetical protein
VVRSGMKELVAEEEGEMMGDVNSNSLEFEVEER